MRPNLEYNDYSFNGQENDGCYNGDNKNCNKFFVSSDVYYGYHLIPSVTQQKTQNVEHMEVDVQHNSGVPLNERLCDHNINRKRPFEYENDSALAPMNAFKKRRENELLQKSNTINHEKFVNLRKPTHNIPDIPRTLMGHYI